MDGAHQLAVLLHQVAEGAAAQRDLHGAAAPAPEARIETGLRQRLAQPRQVRPGAARARRGRVLGDEVVPPFPGERLRAGSGRAPP